MQVILRPAGLILFAFLFIVSCTVSVLPPFDGSLVRKVDELNGKTLALFAAVEDGSPRSDFVKFERDYNDLIGGFEGAITQAKARDIPPLGQRLARSARFETICKSPDAAECLDTTPSDLTAVADGLRDMRNTHKDSGLDDGLVELFKADYELSINAILTIESALER
ncbi:MAG: hypothetical protein ABJQ34_02900 [Paracoccaceae bacterium]